MFEFVYFFLAKHLWVFGVLFFVVVSWWSMRQRQTHQEAAIQALEKAKSTNQDQPNTLHPRINQNLCGGCGACVSVCPEGDILQLIHHKAVLVTPTKCVGHGECQVACPFDAIDLVFGTKEKGMQLPQVDGNYETNVPGLYIAGELGGMGLIRNACKQGKLAAEHAMGKLSEVSGSAELDVLIVGAGPAGLTASMACQQKGLKYKCIEQNQFGGTITTFPRAKVVMSHPIEMPGAGPLRFPKNKVSKEELLAAWGQLREKFQLNIQEHTAFQNLEKKDGVFHVTTNQGPITAKKVILGLGVRGSPRKLKVPGEESKKVAYSLLDPEQFQNSWIAVVGAGNSAVEAAQYLSKPEYNNKVVLLVRGDKMDKCNEDNRNIIEDYARKGRVVISYKTSIKEIHPDKLILKKRDESRLVKNDYVFVFAGALLPFKFLEGLGIKIEMKFGEAVGKSA